MYDLDCAIVTFNCGRELIDPDYFASTLHESLSTPPDLLVLALEEIAPIAHSFLGNSYVAPYLARFHNALDHFVRLCDGSPIRYENVLSTNAGLTGLMLFAQPEIARNLVKIESAVTRVGDYELGNKGSVAARVGYSSGDGETVEMTFVSAHLAASEAAHQRRNLDWKLVVENTVFTPSTVKARTSTVAGSGRAPIQLATEGDGDGDDDETRRLLSSSTDPYTDITDRGLYSPNSYLFVAGDLNYRASDEAPGPDEHKSWPDPSSMPASSPVASSPFATLWQRDQLTREISLGKTLHSLREAPVTFPPTYKYSSAARARAKQPTASTPLLEPAPGDRLTDAWAAHRTPSWCDRILYLAPPHAAPKVGTYAALRVQPSSDHRPVLLAFALPVRSLRGGGAGSWCASPYGVDPGWEARRDRARAREVLVGALAFLVTTWEGWVVLLGAAVVGVGAWAVVVSLV